MEGLHDPGYGELNPADAALLGLLQGPAELLPISSSAHLNLVPWLFDRDYNRLDPELRKSLEVVLHLGTALALLIGERRLLAEELRRLDGRRLGFLALSFAPAAVVGLVFERPIERRLGGPGMTAVGLAVGSAAMVFADSRPWLGGVAVADDGRMPGQRHDQTDAGWRDGLALGLAQAAALSPGVSRNGATLAAARLRGFSRRDANLLSRIVALPVIAGASLLKGVRLWRRGIEPRQGAALGVGILLSFISTLAAQRLIGLVERNRALWPYAVYRLLLAALVLFRRARRRGA